MKGPFSVSAFKQAHLLLAFCFRTILTSVMWYLTIMIDTSLITSTLPVEHLPIFYEKVSVHHPLPTKNLLLLGLVSTYIPCNYSKLCAIQLFSHSIMYLLTSLIISFHSSETFELGIVPFVFLLFLFPWILRSNIWRLLLSLVIMKTSVFSLGYFRSWGLIVGSLAHFELPIM